MKRRIEQLALKYRENAVLRILVRPLWHYYCMCRLSRRNKRFKKYGINLLREVKCTLDEHGIFFWLEFGTLLGAYRDKDFIGHDLDLDIGVYFSDAGKVEKALKDSGFTLIQQFIVGDGTLGLEQTYMYKGVTIDIFYFHQEGEHSIYCNGFRVAKNHLQVFQVKKTTFPFAGFSDLEFKDLIFKVPMPIEEHLKAHYGDNFMVPDPNFNSNEAPNVYYYPLSERQAKLIEY